MFNRENVQNSIWSHYSMPCLQRTWLDLPLQPVARENRSDYSVCLIWVGVKKNLRREHTKYRWLYNLYIAARVTCFPSNSNRRFDLVTNSYDHNHYDTNNHNDNDNDINVFTITTTITIILGALSRVESESWYHFVLIKACQDAKTYIYTVSLFYFFPLTNV